MNSVIATSITKNTAVMMLSQVVTWISSFILMLFLPRYLGSADYGRLYLAISIGMIFQIATDFGGSYFIPKEVSRFPEKTSQLAANFIGIRTVISIGSVILLAVFAECAGYSPLLTTLIIIIAASKLWEGIGGVFRNCMQGFEKMEYSSIAAISERLFLTAAGVGALLLGARSVGIALIMACSTLISSAINFGYFRRLVRERSSIQWGAARRLARATFPYFLYSLCAVTYYRIDAVMLSLTVPEAVVGWYGAAYRFFDIFMFLPSIFATAAFPVLSRLWAKNDGMHSDTTGKSLEFIILAGIPMSILTFGYAGEFIHFFFGMQEYAPSVTILKIFAPGILLVYIDMVLGTALFASDKQRQWTNVAFAALLLNPVMNYFMIPISQTHLNNGGIGAAVATLATEFFVMIAAVYLLPKKTFQSVESMVIVKGVCAGGLMAALIAAMPPPIPWEGRAAAACVVYLLALLSMKTFEPEEIAFLRGFFRVRNFRKLFISKELAA